MWERKLFNERARNRSFFCGEKRCLCYYGNMQENGAVSVGSGGDILLAPMEKKKTSWKKILAIVIVAVVLIIGGGVAWYVVWNMNGADKEEVARVWAEGNESVLGLDEFFAVMWSGSPASITAEDMLFDEDTMGSVREWMVSLNQMYEVSHEYDRIRSGSEEDNAEFVSIRDGIAERHEKYTEYMKNFEEFNDALGVKRLTIPFKPSEEALALTKSDSAMRARAARGIIAGYTWISDGMDGEASGEIEISYVGIFFTKEPVFPDGILNQVRNLLSRWGMLG